MVYIVTTIVLSIRHNIKLNQMKKLASEIKVGDIIKTWFEYSLVLEVVEETKNKLRFKYINSDGIANGISFMKTTGVTIGTKITKSKRPSFS